MDTEHSASDIKSNARRMDTEHSASDIKSNCVRSLGLAWKPSFWNRLGNLVVGHSSKLIMRSQQMCEQWSNPIASTNAAQDVRGTIWRNLGQVSYEVRLGRGTRLERAPSVRPTWKGSIRRQARRLNRDDHRC
jgi:hypothetical protein